MESQDLKDGVFVIIRDKYGGILLVKQNYEGNKWSLPGGGIRFGEIVTHGAERESLEEASVKVLGLKLVGAFTLLKKYGVVFLFEAESWEGIPKPDNKETIDVRFAAPEEMDKEPDTIWTAQRALMHISNEMKWSNQVAFGHLTMPPLIIKLDK